MKKARWDSNPQPPDNEACALLLCFNRGHKSSAICKKNYYKVFIASSFHQKVKVEVPYFFQDQLQDADQPPHHALPLLALPGPEHRTHRINLHDCGDRV